MSKTEFGPKYEQEVVACFLADVDKHFGKHVFLPFYHAMPEDDISEMFNSPRCKLVFAALVRAEKTRGFGQLTIGMVESECIRLDNKNGLFDFMALRSTEFNTDHVKSTSKDFIADRLFEKSLYRAVDLYTEGKYDEVQDTIASANRKLGTISVSPTDFFEASGRYEIYRSSVLSTIPTGFKTLDKALDGGLGRGELGIVFGPAGRGKSFSLMNFGAGALKAGFKVAHLSCEMRQPEVFARYDSLISGLATGKSVPSRHFKHANPFAIRRQAERIKKFLAETRSRFFVDSFSTKTLTVNTVKQYLDKVHAMYGVHIDLLVVDYAGIMRSSRRYEKKHSEVESICEELRGIAGEHGMCVWTASQANRGSLEKETIGQEDLADCYAQAAVSDVLIALCQTRAERSDYRLRMYVDKNREGEDAKYIKCKFLPQGAKIVELDVGEEDG